MTNINIRLLFLIKSLELGGIEKSTSQYATILAEKLDFTGIFAAKGFYDNSDIISRKVHRFFPKFNIYSIFHFFSNLKQILDIVKDNEITHIHYHNRIFIPFLFLIKKRKSKIAIIYSHQNVFADKINQLIIADKIIALSSATKDDLPKRFQKRTTIIPHGVELPKISIHNKEKESIVFGFVGRFVEWKGILSLIDDFVKIPQELNCNLLLVGDGELKDRILSEISSKNLENKIQILGPQTNMQKVYENIDVLILPSQKLEGFGIVLIEAMSFGKPVIVYENRTYKETVINNFNGLYGKENLIEPIRRISTNQDLYKKLCKNALMHAKKFEINLIAKRYLEEIY